MKMLYTIKTVEQDASGNDKSQIIGTQLAGNSQRAIDLFRAKNAMRKIDGLSIQMLALTAKNCNEA